MVDLLNLEPDGYRFYYERSGEGKEPLLFLDRLLQSVESWRPYAEFKNAGYVLILEQTEKFVKHVKNLINTYRSWKNK